MAEQSIAHNVGPAQAPRVKPQTVDGGIQLGSNSTRDQQFIGDSKIVALIERLQRLTAQDEDMALAQSAELFGAIEGKEVSERRAILVKLLTRYGTPVQFLCNTVQVKALEMLGQEQPATPQVLLLCAEILHLGCNPNSTATSSMVAAANILNAAPITDPLIATEIVRLFLMFGITRPELGQKGADSFGQVLALIEPRFAVELDPESMDKMCNTVKLGLQRHSLVSPRVYELIGSLHADRATDLLRDVALGQINFQVPAQDIFGAAIGVRAVATGLASTLVSASLWAIGLAPFNLTTFGVVALGAGAIAFGIAPLFRYLELKDPVKLDLHPINGIRAIMAIEKSMPSQKAEEALLTVLGDPEVLFSVRREAATVLAKYPISDQRFEALELLAKSPEEDDRILVTYGIDPKVDQRAWELINRLKADKTSTPAVLDAAAWFSQE